VWSAAIHAVESGLAPVWVVSGAVELTPALPGEVVILPNPRWAEGQATSLQLAVEAARRVGLETVVVGLGDQPLIRPEAWWAVAQAEAPIAVATYQGRRGHPVRLSACIWDLLPRSGEQGARVVMQQRPDLVLEVPCRGDPADIDTREDLLRWN
jgi:CTP:molybdopterin cytidylyltransferase MocA